MKAIHCRADRTFPQKSADRNLAADRTNGAALNSTHFLTQHTAVVMGLIRFGVPIQEPSAPYLAQCCRGPCWAWLQVNAVPLFLTEEEIAGMKPYTLLGYC